MGEEILHSPFCIIIQDSKQTEEVIEPIVSRKSTVKYSINAVP